MDQRYRRPPRGFGQDFDRSRGGWEDERRSHGQGSGGPDWNEGYEDSGRPPYAPEYYSGPEETQRGEPHYAYRPARRPAPGRHRDEPDPAGHPYGYGERQAGYGREQEYGDAYGSGLPHPAYGGPDFDPRRELGTRPRQGRGAYPGMGVGGGYEGYHPADQAPETGHRSAHPPRRGPVREVEEPGRGRDRWLEADPRGTRTAARRGVPRAPKGYVRSDERIREDICERLMQMPEVDVGEVSVEVSQGVVRLDGTVPERHMKHVIEDVASGCLGVQDVHNQVRVEAYPSPTPSSGPNLEDGLED